MDLVPPAESPEVLPSVLDVVVGKCWDIVVRIEHYTLGYSSRFGLRNATLAGVGTSSPGSVDPDEMVVETIAGQKALCEIENLVRLRRDRPDSVVTLAVHQTPSRGREIARTPCLLVATNRIDYCRSVNFPVVRLLSDISQSQRGEAVVSAHIFLPGRLSGP